MSKGSNDDASQSTATPVTDREISAGNAVTELHYGRLEWLAEHIKVSDFQIHPRVARKILALIERTEPNLFFELRTVRRSDLPPAHKDPQLTEHRNFEMAVEVARRGGFKRGHMKRVCHEVGKERTPKLTEEYVARCVRPYRSMALGVVEEERLQAAYERGEIDFLGRPISPETPFADEQD